MKMGKLKRKSITPDELTEKQKNHLIVMDFLGQLSKTEIPIAKKHGLYKWDLRQKMDHGRRSSRSKNLNPAAGGEPPQTGTSGNVEKR